MKDDTAVELGGPRTAGSTFMIWTENVSLVSDGRVALVGPDVCEAKGRTAPFGQVTLLGGPSLDEQTHPLLERELHAAERLPGYMVRSTGGRIWSRVSYEALDNGFSLRTLGATVVECLRANVAAVTAAEVLFVTSTVEDVRNLERIGAQVRKLSHDLRRQRLVRTGDREYECETGISCTVCPDSEVCSEIREMLVIRKKGGRAGSPSSAIERDRPDSDR